MCLCCLHNFCNNLVDSKVSPQPKRNNEDDIRAEAREYQADPVRVDKAGRPDSLIGAGEHSWDYSRQKAQWKKALQELCPMDVMFDMLQVKKRFPMDLMLAMVTAKDLCCPPIPSQKRKRT